MRTVCICSFLACVLALQFSSVESIRGALFRSGRSSPLTNTNYDSLADTSSSFGPRDNALRQFVTYFQNRNSNSFAPVNSNYKFAQKRNPVASAQFFPASALKTIYDSPMAIDV
uniref:Uncharacterized protein n=1 Tax=Ditylenchus dipsaci TaxID=166011 RepID=A0A915D7F0_9BILA